MILLRKRLVVVISLSANGQLLNELVLCSHWSEFSLLLTVGVNTYCFSFEVACLWVFVKMAYMHSIIIRFGLYCLKIYFTSLSIDLSLSLSFDRSHTLCLPPPPTWI